MEHMKHITLLLTAAIAALSLSCTRELDWDQPSEGERMQVSAVFGDPGDAGSSEDDTKTVLASNRTNVLWSPKEKINVFYDGDGMAFTSINSEPKAKTIFMSDGVFMYGSTEGAEDSSPYFWGIYPYSAQNEQKGDEVTLTVPATQEAVANSFAEGAFPSVARSRTTDLAFYNVCGGLGFTLSSSDIVKVKIRGNNGEDIAGKVRVSFGENERPVVASVVEGKKEIMLNAVNDGGFKAGEWYYISMLPGTFSSGFTVEMFKQGKRGVKTYASSCEVKRSVFGEVEELDKNVTFASYEDDSEEYVNLGLSVKWATCNLGASRPEQYGGYYQWAGTADVTSADIYLDFFNCPYHTGSYYSTGWTKYISKYYSSYWSGTGKPDDKAVLDPVDDAAHVALGGNWRMPTIDEWYELIGNCTLTWTSNYHGTGVAGMIVASNKEGYTDKSIFLPAAGHRGYDNLYNAGTCYYWSSSLNTNYPSSASSACFPSDAAVRYYFDRYDGQSVRPVLE